MKFPCEIKLWYVLPSIRSELARELLKLGLTQREISKKLNLTEASISYYIRERRGYEIKFRDNIKKEIKKLAKDVIAGIPTTEITSRICGICKLAERQKAVCEIHKKIEKVPKRCDICLS
ncbi:MAG: transcriptional regulator [Candidatus Altiarchaeota archaeon]